MNESLKTFMQVKKLKLIGVFFGLVVILTSTAHCLRAAAAEELSIDQFGSLLTLNDAVSRALKSQAKVKHAFARLYKEEALYKGTRAEFFPKLNGEVFSAFATGEKKLVTFLDAGLEQPIFQGGKALAEKRKQKTLVKTEEIKLQQAKLDIELGVRVLYAQVLSEKALTRIAQGQVRELLVEYERVKRLVENKILARYEFFKIETLLQSAKHALVTHKESFDYLHAVLTETIGISEGESLDLELLADFPELESRVFGYMNTARQHDPIYKLGDLKIQEKQYEKHALQAARFPRISIGARWNRNQDVFVDTNRAMIGITGKWDIWDFGRTSSKVRAKSHEIDEVKWEGEIRIREHENQIRRIFHEARAAREKIRLGDALVTERQEIFKNEKTRLISGELGAGELIDSFIALEEAKIKRLEAITKYRVLVTKLRRKTGFEVLLDDDEGGEDVADFEVIK